MMSLNQETVREYMDGFVAGDLHKIQSTLTADVVWILPGAFHLNGKEAFLQEVNNENFIGLPDIKVTRMVEDDNVVVAEGTVRAEKKEGGFLEAVFCDVFLMENTKIKQLTSYLMEVTKH